MKERSDSDSFYMKLVFFVRKVLEATCQCELTSVITFTVCI